MRVAALGREAGKYMTGIGIIASRKKSLVLDNFHDISGIPCHIVPI